MDSVISDPCPGSSSAMPPGAGEGCDASHSGQGFQQALALAQAGAGEGRAVVSAAGEGRLGAVAQPVYRRTPEKNAHQTRDDVCPAPGSASQIRPATTAEAGQRVRDSSGSASEHWTQDKRARMADPEAGSGSVSGTATSDRPAIGTELGDGADPFAVVTDAAVRSSSHLQGQAAAEPERGASLVNASFCLANAGDGRDAVAKSWGQAADPARGSEASTPSGVSMQFPDSSWAVSGLDVAVMADGAIDVILSVDQRSMSMVSDQLDALKRRLAAKGVALAGIQLNTDGAPPLVRGRGL